MALQASGAISLSDLATEFGDTTPNSMSEFYAGGSLVGGHNASVPASGTISLTDFYSATAAIVLDITSSASEQNILTLATAAGYNAASDTTPIIVNIASGVTVSGSSTHALRTGALNADSDLTINISGSVDGYTGATGGINTSGSPGGDALYWETTTGGSGTYIVNVLSGANLRGGGGGGGGGGSGGVGYSQYDGKEGCIGTLIYGSNGASGSAGGFGSAGSAGSAGGSSVGAAPACVDAAASPQPGAAGGAAGFALRKNGRTVTLNNSGTVAGNAA
jgi:hypothetical protein